MALGEVVDRAHLAAVFGVARTTVDAWVADGCPVQKRPAKRGDPAEFDTAAVHGWLVERAVRARMLAIPTKGTPLVATKRTFAEIKQTLTDLVHEALRELSETEVVALAEGDEAA